MIKHKIQILAANHFFKNQFIYKIYRFEEENIIAMNFQATVDDQKKLIASLTFENKNKNFSFLLMFENYDSQPEIFIF